MGNPSHNTLSAIARMTPSLPQRGRQPKGARPPLDPQFRSFFQMRVYGHAPRGEGRQTPSARGSITIQYCPLQVFYRAVKFFFAFFPGSDLLEFTQHMCGDPER
jgi:hypothetical protein